MPLIQQLSEYIAACFTGLWIQSHEHEDALVEIGRLCHEQNWRLATWNVEQGLQIPGQGDADAAGDPLSAIRSINALAGEESSALLVLTNFHRFVNSAEIVQALARQIVAGKQNRTFVVILSPVVNIPTELEKHFVVIEHALPGREQLEEIARGIATEEGELPEGDELVTVLDAAAGLTRYEAEGAFSLSLVREGAIRSRSIWELKSQMLKKSGLLSLHRGSERFDQLGGLSSLKNFCSRALRRRGDAHPLATPRGVMLLGPPGTGKSGFYKALGNETNRPTLMLDIGSLMGSLVGQTEANIRQALKIADAMAPCVLAIDEVEKALSGVASSGQTDSGVSMRLFGTFLTWLNDHTSDVFVVATCNDISKLPPEFGRAERFDGVFFLDLPDASQRRAIWDLYIPCFGLDADQQMPADADWTGAEIRSCCRLAALLDVSLVEAAQNVVPVARTAGESVTKLREWASGRCLSADHAGLYRFGSEGGGKRRRSIPRDPSVN
ncbi:MAG: AAA family ATPase [Pirellulaceae bacterium]